MPLLYPKRKATAASNGPPRRIWYPGYATAVAEVAQNRPSQTPNLFRSLIRPSFKEKLEAERVIRRTFILNAMLMACDPQDRDTIPVPERGE
jgi:hypothetical protein